MKDAWTTNVFPPMQLSSADQMYYQRLAAGLLEDTLHNYEEYNQPHHREMNKKRWKAVRTRENMTVYKEREPSNQRGDPMLNDKWEDPKLLLGVGSLHGSLDDVMYGVATTDSPSMLVKATIVKSGLFDGAVLASFVEPTVTDPFQFVGIKWLVTGPPSSLHNIIWPRDIVYLEATGIRQGAQRIGYQLMLSVDIEGYGNLEEHSIMRGRISMCSIFKEQPDDTVDVYVRGFVEAHGRVLDSVALNIAAMGFLNSWNSVEVAQEKKLMWLAKHAHHKNMSERRQQRQNRMGNSRSQDTLQSRCGMCVKKFSKLSSVGACVLCFALMCSKCRIAKKLHYVDKKTMQIQRKEITICKNCISHVSLHNAMDIAQQEVKEKQRKPSIEQQSQKKNPRQHQHPQQQNILQRHPSSSSSSNIARQHHSMGGTMSRSASSNSSSSSPLGDNDIWVNCTIRMLPMPDYDLSHSTTNFNESAITITDSIDDPLRRTVDLEDELLDARRKKWVQQTRRPTIEDCQEEEQRTHVIQSVAYPQRKPSYAIAQQQQDQHQQSLWQQMHELRLAAENTYLITKQTTDNVLAPQRQLM